MFRPVVVVDGGIVGSWTHDRGKRRSVIRAVSFEALDAASQRRLEEEVADIGRFLGDEASVEVATAGWVPGGVGSGLLVATLLMILLGRRCPALVVRFRPRADLLPGCINGAARWLSLGDRRPLDDRRPGLHGALGQTAPSSRRRLGS